MVTEGTQRRVFLILAVFAVCILLANFALVANVDLRSQVRKLKGLGNHNNYSWETNKSEKEDDHPIRRLMDEAASKFRAYDTGRSRTFAQAVKKYRSKYGRHPPPKFDKWYAFARKRGVHNIDDFDQIWDDLRPFWSIPPAELRGLIKGMLAEEYSVSGLGAVHIRDGKTTKTDDNWRTVQFERMIQVFSAELPDMDIPMNRLDQPRVVVEWEQLQKHLKIEEESRKMPPDVSNAFTKPATSGENGTLPIGEWFKYPGSEGRYMDLAAPACPPESYARNPDSSDKQQLAENMYKVANSGGLVKNFNISSDLCTVGPTISDLHGLLYAASSITATKKLVPVFGECKVNVNNDILFPANMYYAQDERYEYDGSKDYAWDDKSQTVFWRGVTSGGTQVQESWRRLHRHRFVLLTNSTELAATGNTQTVLAALPNDATKFAEKNTFSPAVFAKNHTDIGFSEFVWCVPDSECGFLKPYFSAVSQTTLADQFVRKYLPDIDGHSFSGRWHAFLQSRSMGLKATIFREWHDSRLFAWHHFVPMDNRFDDFYTLMTYFIGVGDSSKKDTQVYMPNHDAEAEILAEQSREWANKVLRREDIDIYMFRLMLEYARLLDDKRDYIGYGGDGREVGEEDWGTGY